MTGQNRQFASLLDDLFLAAEKPVEAPPRPTIPFDYLSVAEELHSGRIRVFGEAAAAEYRDAAESVEAELASLLDEVAIEQAAAASAGLGDEPEAVAITLESLSIEPAMIAVELGLDGAGPDDLGRLRRAFAMKNHPDRMPPQLRERALQRMQVANVLIDEARRRALAKVRR